MRLFLQSVAAQVGQFTPAEMASLSESVTNLITLAMGDLHPLDVEHSRCTTLTHTCAIAQCARYNPVHSIDRVRIGLLPLSIRC